MMKTVEATHLRVAEDITELVGETPMLHLRRIVPATSADVYAKLEYLNPGGSVKDRAAIGIIKRAEEQGLLRKGSTIIEATAGNTGIGLALIGVNRGYRVIFCVPERFSEEKVKVMRALGAEVMRTPDLDGMAGAIKKAREISATIPDSFVALQFENQANPDFHYQTTAREIYEQMEGRVDAVVLGVGWWLHAAHPHWWTALVTLTVVVAAVLAVAGRRLGIPTRGESLYAAAVAAAGV